MGLDDDANATFGRVGEKIGHCDLGSRMQVNFRLFDEHKLLGSGSQQGDDNGKGLRNAEADIGDVHEIVRAALHGAEESADAELYTGCHPPIEPEPSRSSQDVRGRHRAV